MSPNGANAGAPKILAFFGSDLTERDSEFLQRACCKGYTLLALDIAAIGLAIKLNLPYTLIDDWVDSQRMAQAKEEAVVCMREWFMSVRDEFISDGICWPQFDLEAMYWFWFDVTLADAFSEVFKVTGGQNLAVFHHFPLRPSIFYFPSDVCSAFWKAKIVNKVETIVIPRKAFGKSIRDYVRSKLYKIVKIARLRSKHKNDLIITLPSSPREKVVLAFNPGEFYRFTPSIEQLLESFPGKMAAAILWHDQPTANEIATRWSMPVISGPSGLIDHSLQERFMRGYIKARDSADGKPWKKPLEYLQFHFEHYCRHRWPMLAANFRFWLGLWKQVGPKAVIVSTLEDSESQLPAEAAKRLNIWSLSIPHGACKIRSVNNVASDYILYGLCTERIVFERSGYGHRLIAVRDSVLKNEYPVVSTQTRSLVTAWSVLALTNPIGPPLSSISPRAQLAALRALDNPPEDIAGQLLLSIKVHPLFSELELFSAVSDRLAEHVLPPNSDLHSVLEWTDLIVAVNYCGSALVHALRAGKPVIFFWTDRLIGKAEPYMYADVYLPAGVLVRTSEEFWSVVRCFFTDPKMAEHMRFLTREFCRKNLDDSGYPGIGEIVSSIISARDKYGQKNGKS